jgi:uncharacterized protein (TIGR00297 family)
VSAGRAGLGIALALSISLAAYRAGFLSRSGLFAAAVVGALHFGLGGPIPAVLLIAFFLPSSLLTRLGGPSKRRIQAAFAKGGRRDAGQVLANGGLSSLFAALFGLRPDAIWLAAVAGALAAASADTWATELGALSRRPPRRITDLHPVPAGTSGAVSPLGLLASLAGAALISALAGFMVGAPRLAAVGIAAGLGGSLVDSLLGATRQAIYFCPGCQLETERHPAHTCGHTTRHLRGWRWLNNDGVNAAATAVGAFIAVSLSLGWGA